LIRFVTNGLFRLGEGRLEPVNFAFRRRRSMRHFSRMLEFFLDLVLLFFRLFSALRELGLDLVVRVVGAERLVPSGHYSKGPCNAFVRRRFALPAVNCQMLFVGAILALLVLQPPRSGDSADFP